MWTPREEEILAASMIELAATGWKSDNGFRAGYLGKIEEHLRDADPNTNLRSYGLLRSILSRSGVGFNNDGTYKIDCSDDQWDQIVAMNGGSVVQECEAATTRLGSHMSGGSQVQENDYVPSFDFPNDTYSPIGTPFGGDTEVNDSSSGDSGQQTAKEKTPPPKQKKRGRDGDLLEFLGGLHSETNKRLEMISSRIGYEFDMGKARQEIYEKLGTVEGLSEEQHYDLCMILGCKHQYLEIFLGMPAAARLGYLMRVLYEHNKVV